MRKQRVRQPRSREDRTATIALSVEDAARALSISRDSFERHVAPHLRLVSVGRRLVVPVAEIERWIERSAASPPADALRRLHSM